MTTYPRIRPYRTWSLTEGATRSLISAHEIVLERPLGVDLEINLAPHPRFRGSVSFATFRGSSLLIEAASACEAYIFIEAWPVGDRRRKSKRRATRGTPGHAYLVDARGEKRATAARSFVIRTEPRRELRVDLSPARPWAQHVKIESNGRPLAMHLNASNVVFFSVES